MAVTRYLKIVSLAGLLLVSSGCGFHLRESVSLPASLQATAVQGVTEYSQLDLSLKRAFIRAGYPLTSVEQASAILVVTHSLFTRRVLSVNSSGVANEYELQYSLGYRVLDAKKQELLPEQSLTVYGSYRYNPDALLANTAEEERLQKDMIDNAVGQLMRRVNARIKATS